MKVPSFSMVDAARSGLIPAPRFPRLPVRSARLPGEERQVHQAHHPFRSLNILGHAQTMKTNGRLVRGIQSRRLPNVTRFNAAGLSHSLGLEVVQLLATHFNLEAAAARGVEKSRRPANSWDM
jgi:hypothetical protein